LELLPVASDPSLDTLERDRWVRRARLLAWVGLGWHAIEAAVAIGAGVVASSIALVGFGADSLVEALAGIVVIWRFASARSMSEDAETRAQRLIGVSFFAIGVYVGIEAIRTLVTRDHPEVSAVGLVLSAITLLTMPPLAKAKQRVAEKLASSATASEGRQNMLCAYLSAALLVGLGGNALFGWWWLDPLTALVIAGVALKEGREAWRGDGCECCDPT
jgi:divalent metal cation (Fe/Co/Zn/Cd) transporter